MRAFAEHRPTPPWKVWYEGPQFRYEQPQAGRYRQFAQVGIETLGTDDPQADVDAIALGWHFYESLGLREITLLLNSLGDPTCRPAYMDALRTYLSDNARHCRRRAKSRSNATRCGCSTPARRRCSDHFGCAADGRFPHRRDP